MFFQIGSSGVSSPRQQFWVVDASNNVISISEDVSDTSSVDVDDTVTSNDADVSSAERPMSKSDDVASVAAAAVDYVINKVDNDVTKRSNADVTQAEDDDDATHSDDEVTIIGDVTIPHDQSQLMSLYANPGGAGRGRQGYPPPGTQMYVCEICGRDMKSSVALKYHKMHVHKIG